MQVINAKESLPLFISVNHKILSKVTKLHFSKRLLLLRPFWIYSVKLKGKCNATFDPENFGLIQNTF